MKDIMSYAALTGLPKDTGELLVSLVSKRTVSLTWGCNFSISGCHLHLDVFLPMFQI